MENAAGEWLQHDEAAARAAINASDLPDYAKERLLKPGN
jgi:hypothetical protein